MPCRWLMLICLPGLLLLTGCGTDQDASKETQRKEPPKHLVEWVEVVREPVSSSYQRTGSLRARRIVRIHNQEEGFIEQLPHFEGDRVKQGQLLVSLGGELLSAELAKARATTRQARLDLKRIAGLVKKRAASEDELARAKTALDVASAEQKLLETRLGYTRISAPFDGVISERRMEPGDLASRNSHILTLTDPDSLVSEIHVSELLLPHLSVGDQVEVRIDALGSQQFNGRIQRIHPDLSPITRQGVVEVALDPVPAGARAGQFVRVSLESAQVERILLPFAAVRRDKEGEFVYLLDPENRVHRRPVRSGTRIADKVEILEGLDPAQRVISRGFLGLSEGKAVQPLQHNRVANGRSGG